LKPPTKDDTYEAAFLMTPPPPPDDQTPGLLLPRPVDGDLLMPRPKQRPEAEEAEDGAVLHPDPRPEPE
jgi:hypothetical protein